MTEPYVMLVINDRLEKLGILSKQIRDIFHRPELGDHRPYDASA